jgi:hypothetical protein
MQIYNKYKYTYICFDHKLLRHDDKNNTSKLRQEILSG